MVPKTNTNATKLATVLGYFHKSGVAHSIKDLEKALPSVASINGMQVKDYLQALSDENKIRVEKIGSGNWYWAFAGEEKASKERELAKAEEDRAKSQAQVDELRAKIEEAVRVRAEAEADGTEEGQMDRRAATERVEGLKKEVEGLYKELKGYSGNDPVELERQKKEVEAQKRSIEVLTEQIWTMEGYIKDALGMGRDELDAFKRMLYDTEYSEEEGGLKEV